MRYNSIRRLSVMTVALCLFNSGATMATEKRGALPPKAPVAITHPQSTSVIAHLRTPILGQSVLPKEQAIAFIARSNIAPKLNCSVADLVEYYYQEATREGVRADLALSQALLETGFFRYGGDVRPEQNNFCGLGTTAGKRGAVFPDARTGVRAHIQHLMAYSTDRLPSTDIVDPRYFLVWKMSERYAQIRNWEELDGRWASGASYSAKIFAIYDRMRSTPFSSPVETPKPVQPERHFIIMSPEARGK